MVSSIQKLLGYFVLVAILLMLTGLTWLANEWWKSEVVPGLRSGFGGQIGFLIFEFVMSIFASVLVVSVVIQFLNALVGSIFSIGVYGPRFGGESRRMTYGRGASTFGRQIGTASRTIDAGGSIIQSLAFLPVLFLFMVGIASVIMVFFIEFVLTNAPFVLYAFVMLTFLAGVAKGIISNLIYG